MMMKTILGMTLVMLLGGLLQPQVSAKSLATLNENQANLEGFEELRDRVVSRLVKRQASSMNDPMDDSIPDTSIDPTPLPQPIPSMKPDTSSSSTESEDDDCSEEDMSGESNGGQSTSPIRHPITYLRTRMNNMMNQIMMMIRRMMNGIYRRTSNMVARGTMEGRQMMRYMLHPIVVLIRWTQSLTSGSMRMMMDILTLPQTMIMGRSKREASNYTWENALVSFLSNAWNEMMRMSRCLMSPQNEQAGCQQTLRTVSRYANMMRDFGERMRKTLSNGSYENPRVWLEHIFTQSLSWIDDNSSQLERYGLLTPTWASQLHTIRSIVQLLMPEN